MSALHVHTTGELDLTLGQLARSDFLALDTEFMRESTYYAGLCLIQVATPSFCAVIDPFAVPDLGPLWKLLGARSHVIAVHAARQDLEVLSLAMPDPAMPMPGPIFDTQIAAGLLGLPAQIGYGGLVEQRLGHSLPKAHTRTDWGRRPLNEEQLEYAADDVRYLAPLYVDLRAALEAAGRLEWLFEETRELEDRRLYRTEPDDAWRRFKGLDRLRPDQRAALKLLAAWRETLAMKHDKPRGWIVTDEALREISDRLPTSLDEVEKIRSLPPGVVRRRGEEIAELVRQARDLAGNEAASVVPGRPDPRQVALVTKLMNVVRATGERLKISPELLATRRDVEQLVFSGRAERLLTGWRRATIGEELVSLAGRI